MRVALISDFSKTLTDASNPTTWSVFAKSGLLGPDYIVERDELFNRYHPLELAGDIENTKEWWQAHLSLFIKYGLNLNLIKQVVSDEKYFKPRQGLEDFFRFLETSDIDVKIITSSGVSNFIQTFLDVQNISHSQISIIGNTLNIDEDGQVESHGDDIICSLNKDDHNIDLSVYDRVILMGDDESDLLMYKGDSCVRIGFCNQDIRGYDVYLGKDGDLEQAVEVIEEYLAA